MRADHTHLRYQAGQSPPTPPRAANSRGTDKRQFYFSYQYNLIFLPVAQLDSASDSDSEGRRFESYRVGQQISYHLVWWLFCYSIHRFAYRLRYLRSITTHILSNPRRSQARYSVASLLTGRPKIDKFQQKLVDFYFFTFTSSLFTLHLQNLSIR